MDRNYKYLLLDMDMTLLDFKKSEMLAFKGVTESVGKEFSEDDYIRYSNTNERFWLMLDKGLITRKELLAGRFAEFAKRWGEDSLHLNQIFIDNLANSGDWLDGAQDFLKALQKSGKYRTYVASNGPVVTVSGRVRASGLDRFADGVFISEEAGAPKPDPKFFEFVFDKLSDHDVSNYLMIGDRLSSDIKGANNVNMDCVLFAHDGNLPEDLKGCKVDYFAGSYKELQDLLEVP